MLQSSTQLTLFLPMFNLRSRPTLALVLLNELKKNFDKSAAPGILLVLDIFGVAQLFPDLVLVTQYVIMTAAFD